MKAKFTTARRSAAGHISRPGHAHGWDDRTASLILRMTEEGLTSDEIASALGLDTACVEAVITWATVKMIHTRPRPAFAQRKEG
jgi:hypothetical protein